VARTIYLGSAPTPAAPTGAGGPRVKLGCVMPGESPAVFGDALRRLAAAATYLYQDGPRYWYSTQPTVTKLAEDRAEQLKRDPDKVAQELEQAPARRPAKTGDFTASTRCPARRRRARRSRRAAGGAGHRHPYSKGRTAPPRPPPRRSWNRAATRRACTATRWSSWPPTRTRLQDLDEAVRKYLAWESILDEKDTLNLDPHQVRQAETQKQAPPTAR
jgi:hypothetical protein